MVKELRTPADVKLFAFELGELVRARGGTCVIAVSHPAAGWYVRIDGDQPGFEALGLAHQCVRSCEAIVDRRKREIGAEGDV